MAGQGVNMGFGDVISLVNTLERAVQDGADFSMRLGSFLCDSWIDSFLLLRLINVSC